MSVALSSRFFFSGMKGAGGVDIFIWIFFSERKGSFESFKLIIYFRKYQRKNRIKRTLDTLGDFFSRVTISNRNKNRRHHSNENGSGSTDAQVVISKESVSDTNDTQHIVVYQSPL